MAKLFKKSISVFILFCFVLYPLNVHALPQGGSMSAGSGISTVGNDMTVNCTDRCVGTWTDFSIGEIESVYFDQPGVSSIALNKVTGVNPSHILGTLTADGRVFLINPNGILFGVNSQVDTAGLLASTLNLDMSDADFLLGNDGFSFTDLNDAAGTVVNYGELSTLNEAGGFVALLGSSVQNVGTITANVGKVILAAGEKMTIELDPAGSISVAIGDAVEITEATEKNHDGNYAAVANKGDIVAAGGHVILTAEILNGVFDNAVNNDGTITANKMVEGPDGFVLLKSNEDIELNGTIIASGAIDAHADRNVIIGKDIDPLTLVEYDWDYISGSRSYEFVEFGYYYGDGTMKVPLSIGDDIGKDSLSPTDGSGYATLPEEPKGIYAKFDTGSGGILTFYQDAELNPDMPDGLDHLQIADTVYGWEDMLNNGDQDFNDAIINFVTSSEPLPVAPAYMQAHNIFLTASNGYIEQLKGEIHATNLMMKSREGISGIGNNGGIEIHVDNVSAVNGLGLGTNPISGDIRISNVGRDLTIANLSGVSGLNSGISGYDGVTNCAIDGEVNIEAIEGEGADLLIEAPVHSYGPVTFLAQDDIRHTDAGDVTVHNPYVGPGVPTNLSSPSHVVDQYSEDRTVDVTWQLPENVYAHGLVANAGGEYEMAVGTEIKTQGGDVTINSGDDVTLSLIDARNGNVAVTASNGFIIDGDGGSTPSDYDVIARNIKLSAPNGVGVGDAIDLGFPYDFSYLWDTASSTQPDSLADLYTNSFDPISGDWTFATTSDVLSDGSWWFHVNALDYPIEDVSPCGSSQCFETDKRVVRFVEGPSEVSDDQSEIVASSAAHIGPFNFRTDIPPPPPPDDEELAFWQALQEFRVYYEILDPSQFLVYEPSQPIGLYAYHPLTSTDLSAFDDIKLDAGAYDFISDNIEMKKKKANPYFGL